MNNQEQSGEQNSSEKESEPEEIQHEGTDESMPAGPENEENPTFVEIPLSKYKELQEKVTERDEYLEKLRQVTADYDNYQKRMRRQRSEEKKYAARDVMNSIIPVLNDFKHALPDEPDEKEEDLVQGLRMIYEKLIQALQEHDLEIINEGGVPFNPNRHEAASVVEDGDVNQKTVKEILQDGFKLHDQVLQPARVVIAQPPSDE